MKKIKVTWDEMSGTCVHQKTRMFLANSPIDALVLFLKEHDDKEVVCLCAELAEGLTEVVDSPFSH